MIQNQTISIVTCWQRYQVDVQLHKIAKFERRSERSGSLPWILFCVINCERGLAVSLTLDSVGRLEVDSLRTQAEGDATIREVLNPNPNPKTQR